MHYTKSLVAIFLSGILITQSTASPPDTRSGQFDTYEVSFEDLNLAQRTLIFILGLDWSEVYIKTVFQHSANNQKKVVGVSAWSDYEEEPGLAQKDFNMEDGEDSFIDFVTKTKFKKEEVPRILELFNYLYTESTTEEKFSTTNLFEKGGGSMHCKLNKEIQKDRNIVTIHTLNSRGDKNAEIEIIVVKNDNNAYIEKISARLKIGIKIILTRQNPD